MVPVERACRVLVRAVQLDAGDLVLGLVLAHVARGAVGVRPVMGNTGIQFNETVPLLDLVLRLVF